MSCWRQYRTEKWEGVSLALPILPWLPNIFWFLGKIRKPQLVFSWIPNTPLCAPGLYLHLPHDAASCDRDGTGGRYVGAVLRYLNS